MNYKGIGKVYKEDKKRGYVFIEVPRSKLDSAVKKLREQDVTRISSITGYDSGKGFEVIYHFDFRGLLINLKVRLPTVKPCIGTISEVFPGAVLYERELMEMIGVDVEGHPDPRKLFLCEDSPVHPLKKTGGQQNGQTK
jgi:NADH:ubiquinone oxidoreductase subunit C